MQRKLIAYTFLLTAILGLSGCAVLSSAGSMLGIGGNSKTQNSKKSAKSAKVYETDFQLPLRIFAGSNLNAGANGKPLGLVVKIYQLRHYRKFKQAPLKAFLKKKNIQAKLGSDLITSRPVFLLPGESYQIGENIRNGTKYLGIVALFKTPAQGRWRAIFDPQASRDSGITIGLSACALSVTSGQLVNELTGQAARLVGIQCPQR